jgi:hypothetical protein
LSQLIGSTLALEYLRAGALSAGPPHLLISDILRAEYVAPLGSTSLIFNFLFARFLVGTPVTRFDYYGTVTVILGVIGIVAFGSINSGLATDTSVARLATLWVRAGWLGFFLLMAGALVGVYVFASALDAVLAARSDLSAEPFAGMAQRRRGNAPPRGWIARVRWHANSGRMWVGERLETWTERKDDKTIAWTLGIGWACCGGGLAGGCLVFAKAS